MISFCNLTAILINYLDNLLLYYSNSNESIKDELFYYALIILVL